MNIKQIKPNTNNPRIIKGDKFKKLVQSIKDFPEMLKLRPIVIDEDNVVLGGNMRLRACTEAGLTDVPVKVAKGLTEDQKREFIVKDNVGFGEWDWDILANEWDNVLLKDWGMDVWQPEEDYNNNENDSDIDYLDKYLNKDTGVLKLSFLQEQYKEIIDKLDRIQLKEDANDHSETFLKILEKYERI